MIFKSRHLALQTGYDISTDLPCGITLCLMARQRLVGSGPRYRFVLHASWAKLPYIVWRNKHWALNEAGMIGGLPIYRQKPLRWWQRIQHIGWLCHFSFERYPHDRADDPINGQGARRPVL